MARAKRRAAAPEETDHERGRRIYGHLVTDRPRFPWQGMGWEPLLIGPTWRASEDGHWLLPEHSLGWDALGWSHRWLQLGPGQPWRFTDEQARWLLWWYAIDPAGRFLFDEGVLQRIKGWGKDPIGACVCAIEAFGPCRFAGWEDDRPIVVEEENAWVQTAAVSLEQTKNTMRLFPRLFSDAAIERYDIIVGKEKIYGVAGSRLIEAVTSSPRSLQGNRATKTLLNETHEWVQATEGPEMFGVIADNLAKNPDTAARPLAITNAYDPGEDSVAQQTREAYEHGLAEHRDLRLLYDTIEAPPEASFETESIVDVVTAIRGDSVWLLPERIIQRIKDERTPPSRARRYWYNQVTATEDAVFSPQEWDGAADPSVEVPAGAIITMGMDPSEAEDHTALIGCLVEEDHVFPIAFFEPSVTTGLIDRAAVDRAVREAFEAYDVVGFYSDVHPFESEIDRWEEEFGERLCVKSSPRRPIAWDMRGVGADGGARQKMMTQATERFVSAVIHSAETKAAGEGGARLTHDGDRRLRWYVLNAYRKANRWGFVVRKESRDSKRKIDALPAAILARLARLDYLALPRHKQRRRRTGKAHFV